MDRCDCCKNISKCAICGTSSEGFHHVGVRGTTNRLRIPVINYNVTYDEKPSGVWHYSQPCNHRVCPAAASSVVKYNGGPLWKDGYVAHLESDASYSGGLGQYNVGIGKVIGPVIVQQDPPSQLSNDQIAKTLIAWASAGTVADLSTNGAYNIFLPPGTTASLSSDLSCNTFCDYHETANGPNGPFYTVEPYPCAQGCNQCTKDTFDTLTQGLSEEMVELKTDMDPGQGGSLATRKSVITAMQILSAIK